MTDTLQRQLAAADARIKALETLIDRMAHAGDAMSFHIRNFTERTELALTWDSMTIPRKPRRFGAEVAARAEKPEVTHAD